MKKLTAVAAAIAMAFLLTQVTIGKADDPNMARKSLEGTISEIQSTLITINHNAPAEPVLQNVALEINKGTVFQGVNSVDELKKGDAVKVEYEEQGEKKIALEIAKVGSVEPLPSLNVPPEKMQ